MPRRRILQVFNRYVFMGGEEKSVDRIYRHLGEEHDVARCFFESKDWTGADAPGKLGQLRRTIYNQESRARLEAMIDEFKPDVALFHNAFPVGSPSLYHAASKRGLPVIHYAHNFRPLSISGTLYAGGRMLEQSLHGNYWPEVRHGAWQGSVLKSAVMALVLKLLHKSGWLGCVKAWVCISEFLQGKFTGAGFAHEDVFALRHSWDAMPSVPAGEDSGAYLFLGRLVEVKGIEVMLRAWRTVRDRTQANPPELWIAGEGPLEGMVREEAAHEGSGVRFLGLISGDEKADALRRCRALLAPSVWHEPLGLVAYEAYDFAKPVLAAASGGLSETVQHGVTGWLHQPGDANDLARTWLEAEAAGESGRMQMGQAGRDWLLVNAGVPRWKAAFEKILDHALDRRA